MNPENLTPIEHQNVPQAHQGLHDFLYSSTDEHSVETTAAVIVQTDEPVAVEDWCDQTQNAKVAGVYAVLDRDRQTQFIGYSRNVALSLRSHLTQMGAEVCALVTVEPFKFPKRDAMEQLRDEWIAALPSPPPGNVNGNWATTVKEAATQVMSAEEREAYEAKKLKLRKAMADGTLNREEMKVNASDSRQDLAAAMNEDNWSAVVRAQTKETIDISGETSD
jgi:hypothetical protein